MSKKPAKTRGMAAKCGSELAQEPISGESEDCCTPEEWETCCGSGVPAETMNSGSQTECVCG